MPSERIVVALGGNALARAGGDGTWAEEARRMREVAPALADLVRRGHSLVLTHGNGPQVGRSLRQNEIARREVPPRPLDVLDAETEGQVGYLIQTELGAAMGDPDRTPTILPIICRMVVSPRDAAFRHPTKPIGEYYSETEARLLRKLKGWTLEPDPGRGGYRRVVPSPRPVRWVEGPAVARLLGPAGQPATWIPVVAGGGGVPVFDRGHGRFEGVEAVIDKDLAAAIVARTVGASRLAIVTDVPAVLIGFRKPWERSVSTATAREMREWLRRGEFGVGSMAPKVEAALAFLGDSGREAIITDPPSLARALDGEAGTRIRGAPSEEDRRASRPAGVPPARARNRTASPSSGAR